MTYDSLPTNISDRNVQFYVHNGVVRWWNGEVLCCVHKKQMCNVCFPHRREYFKKYREDNKEKIKKYREDNKEKIKKYYEDNKEKIKERKKEYYEDNRESINYKRRVKYYKKRGFKPGDIRVKVHEQDMIQYLEELYPSSEMILGKSIGNECTPRNTHLYPDVQLWCGPFLIVFECDENAHRAASYDCDYARMNRIAISVGCPVWFIRWNPHGNEKIERLGETAQRINNTNSSGIVWTENKQFNVTYIGYNERQLDRNALRKKIAHLEQDTTLTEIQQKK